MYPNACLYRCCFFFFFKACRQNHLIMGNIQHFMVDSITNILWRILSKEVKYQYTVLPMSSQVTGGSTYHTLQVKSGQTHTYI